MTIKTLAELNEAVARFIQSIGSDVAVVVVFADIVDAAERGDDVSIGVAATTHSPAAMLQLLGEGTRMTQDLLAGKEQAVDMTGRDPTEISALAIATRERKTAKLN